MSYDSRVETFQHINIVQNFLARSIIELIHRQAEHDLSKLLTPEVEVFDQFTPRLRTCTYGSDEYKGFLAEMKPALDHHYSKNRHHPEFQKEEGREGILGMTLVDLIEMICDWMAAATRHANGDVMKSIEINQKRFGYSDELKAISSTR